MNSLNISSAAEAAGVSATLERLAARCHGDDRPECPILDELARPEKRRTAGKALKRGT